MKPNIPSEEIESGLDGVAATTKGVPRLKDVFSQGCSRKDGFLCR